MKHRFVVHAVAVGRKYARENTGKGQFTEADRSGPALRRREGGESSGGGTAKQNAKRKEQKNLTRPPLKQWRAPSPTGRGLFSDQ